MFCSKCGNAIAKEEFFCGNCGETLSNRANHMPPVNAKPAVQQNYPFQYQQPTTAGKSPVAAGVCLIFSIFSCVGAFVALYLASQNPREEMGFLIVYLLAHLNSLTMSAISTISVCKNSKGRKKDSMENIILIFSIVILLLSFAGTFTGFPTIILEIISSW